MLVPPGHAPLMRGCAFSAARAAAAVAAPVPPCAIDSGVVSPERDVMSELAPLAATPRFDRAPAPVVAPVPPEATPLGPVSVAADANSDGGSPQNNDALIAFGVCNSCCRGVSVVKPPFDPAALTAISSQPGKTPE